jgi:hypothetical protein
VVGWNCHCWAVLLLQVYCWTAVPLAVAAARASTHLPLCLAATVFQPVGEMAAVASGEFTTVNVVAATAATVAAAIAANRRSRARGGGRSGATPGMRGSPW